MARRVMTETDARELYRELCRVDNGACGVGLVEAMRRRASRVLGLRAVARKRLSRH